MKIKRLLEKTRNGKTHYYWNPSKALQLDGWAMRALGQDRHDAICKAEKLNEEVDGGETPLPQMTINTLGYVAMLYRHSTEFTGLKPRTKKEYHRVIAKLENWAGDAPVDRISVKATKEYYTTLMQHSHSQANGDLRVLSLLFSFAIREELAKLNPAKYVRKSTLPPRTTTWTPSEIEHFIETADTLGYDHIADAVVLAYNTAQRQSDILNMRWMHYDVVKDSISVTQSKTGTKLNLPVLPALKSRLDGIRQRAYACLLIINNKGKGITQAGFQKQFSNIRRKAGLSHLRFHDLRGTAITRLANAGATTPEIASISGHSLQSVDNILKHYLVHTDKQASNAIDKIKLAEGI